VNECSFTRPQGRRVSLDIGWSMQKAARMPDNKHERILKAAISVFARNGFFNSRISEIAREADVADGTIYLYFKNKDDILISIFEESLAEILKKLEASLEEYDEPLEKLHAFVVFHLEQTMTNPALAEVLQVELRQSTKFMKEYQKVTFAKYLDVIQAIVTQGQTSGEIRKDVHPGVIKRLIFGALDEIALHWVLSRRRYDLKESAEQLASVLVAGLRADTSIAQGDKT
jgi:TetR/AcrR family transcriptional regulator, fatty acid metabolism regulator protein